MTRRHFLGDAARAAAAAGLAAGRSTAPGAEPPATASSPSGRTFYLPENPACTIVDSAADSLRFTLTRCLTTYRGHACSTSTFVDTEGAIMGWHDFGPLEGPGWAANAVGGARELIGWARFMGRPEMERTALSVLDHVLENGFIDASSGLIRGYRHVPRDALVLNFKHNNDWFCPGSTARVAVQMLQAAELDERRRGRLQAAATGYARWLDEHLRMLPSGWFPRRCTPTGAHYTQAAEGGTDRFFDGSADGLFILQLWAELTAGGLADYRAKLARGARVFMEAGGIYGSINHDTYDAHENVAYACAFRILRRASQVLDDPEPARFAHRRVLPGLDRFQMHEDRNGVATRGLLWMEESWDTAYLWENAEAAMAYFEAATDTGRTDHLLDGLTILRAAAKHHYGPHGFLTEGVDWNNHVGREHHIDGAKFGAIRYTEPFLNNQHIVEPTLYYLAHHARHSEEAGRRVWRDVEGNVLLRLEA